MIDEKDRIILSIIQSDAGVSKAELGRRVGLTAPAVMERLRRLEQQGVIVERVTKLNPTSLGLGLLAFVFVKTDPTTAGAEETALKLANVPGVQEVHHIAGEDCFLVKVRARDPESLGQLLRREINGITSIQSTRTTIVLETFTESIEVPVPGG